jgi:AcrR family transcriptional regulator
MIAGVASSSRPYHHGNLRPALISAAIGEIEESGPAAMSLRAVARRAGVTHAAAAYHFGDRAGLLTTVAAEGYRLLAEALRGAQETRGSFLEVGVAYVRFAVTHRAHFEVMYRPELYHRDDAELGRARGAAATLLYGTGEITRERMAYGVAAWSMVHGLATLWLNGNLPAQLGDDPEEITRVVAAHLCPPQPDPALARRQRAGVGGRIADSTHEGGKLMPSVRAARKLRPDRDLLRGPRPRKATRIRRRKGRGAAVALDASAVRGIVERVFERREVLAACQRRDRDVLHRRGVGPLDRADAAGVAYGLMCD